MNKLSAQKQIWILNPYEPLPHEGAVCLRYGSLAAELLAAGHCVTWWSSDWSHAHKHRRLSPSESEGEGGEPVASRELKTGELKTGKLEIKLIPVPAYDKNISLARVWNHRCYARGIRKAAPDYVAAHGAPDVILFSLPPMETGDAALALGHRYGARVVLDVMDAWPDALLLAAVGAKVGSYESEKARMWERVKLWAAKLVLTPYSRMLRRYCRQAHGVCAQSQAFADYATRHGARGEIPVFHLCAETPSGQLRTTSDEGSLQQIDDSLDEKAQSSCIRLVYLGSMGRVYDLETLVEAVRQLEAEGQPVTLDLIGQGEQSAQLAERAAGSKAICLHGYVEGAALEALLADADVGVIAMHPQAAVAIPYKAPHYLANGLYVLNTLPGELQVFLDRYACGAAYRAGSVESLVTAVRKLIECPEQLEAGKEQAHRLHQAEFESKHTHQQMAAWLLGK